MSEQEAIQVFQELLDVPKEMLVRHEYALYEEQKEKINKVYLAEQMAIKALEKQIPKKPDIEGDGYADGQLVYDTWICPNCEEHYEIDYDYYDYCPKCGQAIYFTIPLGIVK